jgi:hypothetical protein
MRVYYQCDDPVVILHSQDIAEQLGCELTVLGSNETPLDDFAPLVVGLDGILDRQAFLDSLLGGAPPTCPLSVHSYNLSDEDEALLRGKGIRVFYRLCPEVFQPFSNVRPRPRPWMIVCTATYRPCYLVVWIVKPQWHV